MVNVELDVAWWKTKLWAFNRIGRGTPRVRTKKKHKIGQRALHLHVTSHCETNKKITLWDYVESMLCRYFSGCYQRNWFNIHALLLKSIESYWIRFIFRKDYLFAGSNAFSLFFLVWNVLRPSSVQPVTEIDSSMWIRVDWRLWLQEWVY